MVYVTNVQFQVRGRRIRATRPVMEVADWIRDVLVQYAGDLAWSRPVRRSCAAT